MAHPTVHLGLVCYRDSGAGLGGREGLRLDRDNFLDVIIIKYRQRRNAVIEWFGMLSWEFLRYGRSLSALLVGYNLLGGFLIVLIDVDNIVLLITNHFRGCSSWLYTITE